MAQNAVELIKADHRKVEGLYEQYQNQSGQSGQGQTLVGQICQELTVHAELEESLFYPAVRAKLGEDGRDLVEEALEEHGEMKDLISQLQAGDLASPDEGLVHELMDAVQHHVQEEETNMLPQAEQQLGPELDRLGAQMQQRKQALAASPDMGQAAQGTAA